eukprot:TRINITY_DN17212_c0_g1_i1.p1 TRINITY_DN17212_c0_g1~~TRINITY_DN17212_c0_g1_i1.p1  ORF type:complete len:432 (-),score=192.81 TRINITY_DN17212_c0_g1_i1:117-1412(-)
MQAPMLTEIPSSLKQLARLVVRGFYDIEYSLIVDMLVRYPCMREDDLCELLKFDKKILRAKLATLRSDKFVQVKLKIETGEDGKACKVNCFFINYKIFVNIVKYKLDHMRKKMETEERDATSRSSFRCTNCNKQFTDLEADMLFDFVTQEFKCTYCNSTVEEDESAMPKKDSRLLLAKFNDQMEKLYELLRIVEDIRLSPEVLEPDPVDIMSNAAGDKKNGPQSGDMNDGKWSGETSRGGGFRMEDQQVNITFGEEHQKEKVKKEVPTWITESTVADAAQDAVAAMGPSMGLVEEDDTLDQAPDDEITSLLLRHEKTNKEKGASGVVIPGDDSDSDNRSDDSDMEQGQDNVDRDAAILAAEFAGNDFKDEEEDVGVMEEDSDGDDDIPTINVGGEEFDITDVTTEIIAKMTTEEMEKYNQLYQDFYKDMYD